jgi:AraC-like DNA-binding protein
MGRHAVGVLRRAHRVEVDRHDLESRERAQKRDPLARRKSAPGRRADARALLGHDLVAPAEPRILRPAPAALSRLKRLHRTVGDLAETAAETLQHPQVALAIEDALVRAMVACPAFGGESVAERSSQRRALTIMRRFEQFVEARENEPIYLTDLCTHLGVPGRTLRRIFLEHLGMSPRRYLWLRRMHLVRRELSLAVPPNTSVTEIANEFGFGELGRFAVEYRKLFGELPSATLRRPADARTTADGYLGKLAAFA